MKIAEVLAIKDKINFNLRVKTEVDNSLVSKITEGKAVDNMFDLLNRESREIKTSLFKDERGMLKYSTITGQILDWTVWIKSEQILIKKWTDSYFFNKFINSNLNFRVIIFLFYFLSWFLFNFSIISKLWINFFIPLIMNKTTYLNYY